MFLCMMLYLVDRHGGIEGASMCCVKGESEKTLHGSGSGGEQDPTERAFYRAFCDFNLLNDLGSE